MDIYEFHRLATAEAAATVSICRLPSWLAQRIGATATTVFLSNYTLRKQLTRHRDLGFDHYETMQYIIDHGIVLQNPKKPKLLYFILNAEPTLGRWVKVTIKADRTGFNLFLVSSHKIRDGDRATLSQRSVVIRDAVPPEIAEH